MARSTSASVRPGRGGGDDLKEAAELARILRGRDFRGDPLVVDERAISKEIAALSNRGPAAELERCLAQAEAHFLFRLQTVGGFGGKSDQLNAYNVFLGNPGYFELDLERYRAATTEQLRQAAAKWLKPNTRVVLSVVPRGRVALALSGSQPVAVS